MRQDKTSSSSIDEVLQFYLSAAQLSAAQCAQLDSATSSDDHAQAGGNVGQKQMQPLHASH